MSVSLSISLFPVDQISFKLRLNTITLLGSRTSTNPQPTLTKGRSMTMMKSLGWTTASKPNHSFLTFCSTDHIRLKLPNIWFSLTHRINHPQRDILILWVVGHNLMRKWLDKTQLTVLFTLNLSWIWCVFCSAIQSEDRTVVLVL